jgi:hypothetical protein
MPFSHTCALYLDQRLICAWPTVHVRAGQSMMIMSAFRGHPSLPCVGDAYVDTHFSTKWCQVRPSTPRTRTLWSLYRSIYLYCRACRFWPKLDRFDSASLDHSCHQSCSYLYELYHDVCFLRYRHRRTYLAAYTLSTPSDSSRLPRHSSLDSVPGYSCSRYCRV